MARTFTPGRPHWWQWLTVLSLDAPLVAVAWQGLFARVLDVRLGWHDPALLGLVVWWVYAADRWIEGWRLAPEAIGTQRHFFYVRHRRPVFAAGCAVALAASVIAVLRLDSREWLAGILLLAATLVYLLSHQTLHRHHPLRAPKEIVIAIIFAAGTALAPAAHATLPALASLPVPLVLFALLCFANCGLISVWERHVDAQHGQTSLALSWPGGHRVLRVAPWGLALVGTAVLAFGPAVWRECGGCTLASGVLLGALDCAEPWIGRQLARAAVDVMLMTPLLWRLFN